MTMKKILLSFLALGGLLFASSCQMDEPDAGTLTGEVDFTITAGIPGSINTYASNDGGSTNVDERNYDQRFILEVYDGENYTNLAYREVKIVEVGEKTSFDVRLLAKKYTFALWADFVENGSEGDNIYNTSNGLREVTIKENRCAGSEVADAYCYSEEVDLTEGSLSKTFNLKRPFGKIRLISTDKPANDVNNGNEYTPESVNVNYGTDVMVPTGYNVLTGEASGKNAAAGSYKFTPYSETVSVGGENKGTLYILGIDYIIASKSATSVSFDVKVDDNGTRSVTNIPVSANKLTTVIGNFYSNEGNIEVIVDDEFNDLEDVREVWDGSSEEPTIDDNAITINSAEQLAGLAKMVNEGNTLSGYTVTLNTDIDLNNQPWTPIGPSGDGKNKFMGTFDGGNHTISNLKVTQEAGYHAAGLFGALNGTVKDLIIDGATIENLSSGLSTVNGTAVVAGSIYNSGLIDKVTVKNATVQGNRYLGGISGYVYGSITNCSVETITLVATPDNLTTGTYDNGDKVGGIVGFSASDNGGTISGNHAENVTIKGYRDLGGIAGAANASALTGNTASNITITVDQVTGWYGDETANAGIILGRKLDNSTLDGNNTESGENSISKSYLISQESDKIDANGVILFTPESNSTYIVAEGNYNGIQVYINNHSDNITNVSMIAQNDNVAINGNVTFGTHSNRDRSIPASILFKGFTVKGELKLNISGKVVAENNKAAQLTVKTFGLTDNPSYTSDITLSGNTIDGTLATTTPQGYAVFIVPNVTGYKLTVTDNIFKNVLSHCFTIQGCGDGSAKTTIGEYSITGNTFESWGLGGEKIRGAVKVWADTEIAPEDLTGSSVDALSEKAKDFVKHILDKNNDNKFPSQLPDKCCIFEFYGLAFNSL